MDINILMVDDDINMLNIGENILMGAGYKVSLTKNGSQALKILEKRDDIKLILLDVDMPEMDGYETLKRIKELPGKDMIPVIFLTGMDSPDFEIKGLESGAVDYITKPFVKEVLLARIKKQIVMGDAVRHSAKYKTEGLEKIERKLTSTEIVIAKMIADGKSNPEIAEETHYSYRYVKKVCSSIFEKLELDSRSEIRKLLRNE